MKLIILMLLAVSNITLFAQQNETIEIPKVVAYKYSDSATNEKARTIIKAELSASAKYALNRGILIIGPVLWSRYKDAGSLQNIKDGNVTLLGYKKEPSAGKITQNDEDFKLVWDHFREEVGNADFKLRKATVPN